MKALPSVTVAPLLTNIVRPAFVLPRVMVLALEIDPLDVVTTRAPPSMIVWPA